MEVSILSVILSKKITCVESYVDFRTSSQQMRFKNLSGNGSMKMSIF